MTTATTVVGDVSLPEVTSDLMGVGEMVEVAVGMPIGAGVVVMAVGVLVGDRFVPEVVVQLEGDAVGVLAADNVVVSELEGDGLHVPERDDVGDEVADAVTVDDGETVRDLVVVPVVEWDELAIAEAVGVRDLDLVLE